VRRRGNAKAASLARRSAFWPTEAGSCPGTSLPTPETFSSSGLVCSTSCARTPEVRRSARHALMLAAHDDERDLRHRRSRSGRPGIAERRSAGAAPRPARSGPSAVPHGAPRARSLPTQTRPAVALPRCAGARLGRGEPYALTSVRGEGAVEDRTLNGMSQKESEPSAEAVAARRASPVGQGAAPVVDCPGTRCSRPLSRARCRRRSRRKSQATRRRKKNRTPQARESTSGPHFPVRAVRLRR
jgi:hypothetical protein